MFDIISFQTAMAASVAAPAPAHAPVAAPAPTVTSKVSNVSRVLNVMRHPIISAQSLFVSSSTPAAEVEQLRRTAAEAEQLRRTAAEADQRRQQAEARAYQLSQDHTIMGALVRQRQESDELLRLREENASLRQQVAAVPQLQQENAELRERLQAADGRVTELTADKARLEAALESATARIREHESHHSRIPELTQARATSDSTITELNRTIAGLREELAAMRNSETSTVALLTARLKHNESVTEINWQTVTATQKAMDKVTEKYIEFKALYEGLLLTREQRDAAIRAEVRAEMQVTIDQLRTTNTYLSNENFRLGHDNDQLKQHNMSLGIQYRR